MPPALLLARGPAGDAAPKAVMIMLGIGLLAAAPAPPARLVGNWAAKEIALRTLTNGTIIQGRCATGKVTGAIPLDAKGRFDARGYFNTQRTGYRLSDLAPRDTPATFIGTVAGNKLALTIRRTGEADQRYTLVRDAPVKFAVCR